MKLTVMFANANNNLSAIASKIEAAVLHAEKYVDKELQVNYGVNLVFAELDHFLIPEDGVGGRTYRADFVLITLDLKRNPSENTLFEIICHELCHAARWSVNPEYMNTLFDGIINEGIATMFEAVAVAKYKEKQTFLKTILDRNDAENERILNTLKPQLNSTAYSYNEIFFDGKDELPRWAGYSVGYYLVKKYLSATGKTISQAFADKYASFKMILD